jgi:hypothetical protein
MRSRMRICQKFCKPEGEQGVRMCCLQSAKDCASVRTSLATVHARAQEMGNKETQRRGLYMSLLAPYIRAGPCFGGMVAQHNHERKQRRCRGRDERR